MTREETRLEPHTTLVTTALVHEHLDDENWAIIDCRFQLGEPAWGRPAYQAGHIPGAVYAHLDDDLSSPATEQGGRHPLPDPEALRSRFSSWGIGPGVQVVAYDQDAGLFASRLWWLLRAFGHEAVAVLDGGFAKWKSEGRPVARGMEHRKPAVFTGAFNPEMFATADEVARAASDESRLVIDVRAPERYRGDEEPIDPVAGHIPGAVNRFVGRSLKADNTFRPASELKDDFSRLFGPIPSRDTIVYCGSGVFSCHTLLAMTCAGFEPGRLYPGSWSQWCRDASRPVARGSVSL